MPTIQLLGSNIDEKDSHIVEPSKFSPVTEDELPGLLWITISKSCELDRIPAPVLKKCFHVLLSIIAKTVNY